MSAGCRLWIAPEYAHVIVPDAGIDCGLFGIDIVRQVVRQAALAQQPERPFAARFVWSDTCIESVATHDQNLFASVGTLQIQSTSRFSLAPD